MSRILSGLSETSSQVSGYTLHFQNILSLVKYTPGIYPYGSYRAIQINPFIFVTLTRLWFILTQTRKNIFWFFELVHFWLKLSMCASIEGKFLECPPCTGSSIIYSCKGKLWLDVCLWTKNIKIYTQRMKEPYTEYWFKLFAFSVLKNDENRVENVTGKGFWLAFYLTWQRSRYTVLTTWDPVIKIQNWQVRKPAKALKNLLATAQLTGPFTDREVYCCLKHRYTQSNEPQFPHQWKHNYIIILLDIIKLSMLILCYRSSDTQWNEKYNLDFISVCSGHKLAKPSEESF